VSAFLELLTGRYLKNIIKVYGRMLEVEVILSG
jgi:hypothetical protein